MKQKPVIAVDIDEVLAGFIDYFVGVIIDKGAERPVSVGRDTARGITFETVGKSAVEVAITDPSLIRPVPKQQGQSL